MITDQEISETVKEVFDWIKKHPEENQDFYERCKFDIENKGVQPHILMMIYYKLGQRSKDKE